MLWLAFNNIGGQAITLSVVLAWPPLFYDKKKPPVLQ